MGPATDYNRTITSPEKQDANDYILRWLVPALLALWFVFAWSDHFDNGFHADDFPAIVNNTALRGSGGVMRFFRSPRIFSARAEQADYRPLVSATYALDYKLTGAAEPRVFQVDSFVWFCGLCLMLYWLFRVVPGGGPLSAA